MSDFKVYSLFKVTKVALQYSHCRPFTSRFIHICVYVYHYRQFFIKLLITVLTSKSEKNAKTIIIKLKKNPPNAEKYQKKKNPNAERKMPKKWQKKNSSNAEKNPPSAHNPHNPDKNAKK